MARIRRLSLPGRRRTNHRDAAPAWSMAMGANVVDGGATFRVWAPDAHAVDVEIGNAYMPMRREDDGTWTLFVDAAGAGARYRYRVDGEALATDPYSRSQPEGPHGPSEVSDPSAFTWRTEGWRGVRADADLVIYECHVGTHTPEGTFDALAGDLATLRGLGVTAIELMPVAEFPGTRNWGYDGVNVFAPSHVYGGPDGLKRLIDAAHGQGIAVILDVVYNHFGPEGNYLLRLAREYLTDRHQTPWGDAVNYDGPRSEHVRRLVIDNACYWLTEYRVDGLRLDATFAIVDTSPRHILAELTEAARTAAAGRDIVLIAETYENDARYARPVADGGLGFDAVWSDDFHHTVHAATSHEHSGYYADFHGTTAELARTINRGWLFEGQASEHHSAPRGTPTDGLDASNLVYFIQNHDQVGNRAFGRRLSHMIGPAACRPWAALLLLLPYTPMLFAGEEFAASSRFLYFTDLSEEFGRGVREGRLADLASHPVFAEVARRGEVPDPQDAETFQASKLNLAERSEGVGEQMMALYAACLALRRGDPVLSRRDRARMHAHAASDQLLLVRRWHGAEQRLIAVNTGVAIDAAPAAAGIPDDVATLGWRPLLCTDERRFGGAGDAARLDAQLVSLPPASATLFAARRPVAPLRIAQRMARRRR